MTDHLQLGLLKAGLGIFEELGFILPSSSRSQELDGVEFCAAASIDFAGPINGTIVLGLRGDVLPVLTANMLGEDDTPAPSLQSDALKEVINVICGNLLPHIAGLDAVFQIGQPKILDAVSADEDAQPAPAARQRIGLECGQAELLLFLSNGPITAEQQK